MEQEARSETALPQNVGEFIARYQPLFDAAAGQLVAVVEHDDESSFRGGPFETFDVFGGGRGGDGVVKNSSFLLAVIKPQTALVRQGQLVALPVVSGAMIHGHGLSVSADMPMIVDIFHLSKMATLLTLIKADMSVVQVPEFAILVGDVAVAKLLERVGSERELLAILVAARKLGHPIVRSEAINAVVGTVTSRAVDALVTLIAQAVPHGEYSSEIDRHLAALRQTAIEPGEVRRLCLQRFGHFIDVALAADALAATK